MKTKSNKENIIPAAPKKTTLFLVLNLWVWNLFAVFFLMVKDPSPVFADPLHGNTLSTIGTAPITPRFSEIKTEWGGHLRLRGTVSRYAHNTFYRSLGPLCYDGSTDFRLKNQVFFPEGFHLETHYEVVYADGDTQKTNSKTAEQYPSLFPLIARSGIPGDTLQLLDLTGPLDRSDGNISYHRVDRLALTMQKPWGTIGVGRQAITWGNGMLFNPMDLFNPFSPTDIDRDDKGGNDMVSTQFRIKDSGNVQFLYVPRRDPDSHHVRWDQSSVAGKLYLTPGDLELHMMGARHYRDAVVGIGATGYVHNAVWRLDTTWTFLDNNHGKNGFLSLVANMDHAWIWWDKNCYGFFEFYFNGLGDDDYSVSLSNPDFMARVHRGESFTMGRIYMAAKIRTEWHPLLNMDLSIITNLSDPSGLFQSFLFWDVVDNVQIKIGVRGYFGGTDTEYGGYKIEGTPFINKPPNGLSIRGTYFF